MNSGFLITEPGDEPVVLEARFAANAERVFRAWTDPGQIPRWFGRRPNSVASASIDLRIGGAWRFEFEAEEGATNALFGEYLLIKPNRRLVFSWNHEMTTDDGRLEVTPTSTVSVVFEALSSGTRLKIRHEGIVRESGRRGVAAGWEPAIVSLRTWLDSQLTSER